MKNWIKNEYNFFERSKNSITQWLAEKSAKYKKIEKGPFKFFKQLALHREMDRPLTPITPPKDIHIGLLSLIYLDIVFIEDYDKLFSGLSILINNFNKLFTSLHIERLKKWIEESKNGERGHGYFNVGWFALDSDKSISPLKEFKNIQIHLNQVVPSFIAVIFICQPSRLTKKNFIKLIYQKTKSELNIHGISFKSGITSLSTTPPALVKEYQVNELMLKTQKRIIKFLREYLNCGFLKSGPIKSIEVFQINHSLETYPRKFDPNEKRDRELDSFLETLGKKFFYNDYYSDYYRFYRNRRSRHYTLNDYQILISERDYKTVNPPKENEQSNIMYIEFSHEITYMSVFLSLEFLFEHLQKTVIDLRSMISSTILRKGIKKIFNQSLTALTKKYTYTNETNFKYQRSINEIDFERIKKYYLHELNMLSRNEYDNDSIVTYFDDFEKNLEEKQKFIKSNLDYLRTYFSDFLTFRYTKSNIRLQRFLVFLTIILTILTILLVDQSQLWKDIINYIKDVFN